jgi:hypothetical protein
MPRKLLRRWAIVPLAAVALLIGLGIASPAQAESGFFNRSKNMNAGGGNFTGYVEGDYHGWYCSWGLKHCVDLNNLYAENWKYGGTTPNLMRVQESFAFGGYSLNVSWYAGFEAIPNGCRAPGFSYSQSYSTFVSSYTGGVVCHADTYLAVTGVWADNLFGARYSSSWSSTTVTASHNVAGDP